MSGAAGVSGAVSVSGAADVSVREALAGAAARLSAAGCETPRLDAEVLLAWVLGVDRGRLVIDSRAPLPGGSRERFQAAVSRREAREPVAYITGFKSFRRLELEVDRRVLIPRPETELLVELGLTLPSGTSVLDVGTGSGAVALALKDERPDLLVTGVDVSGDALALARENAARLGLSVAFLAGDLLDGVPGGAEAVLANLPYVRDGEALAPEITRYEPARALFGGPDGLDLVRRLVAGLSSRVGVVGLEVGIGQADAVSALLADAGFEVARRRDLAGIERVVTGAR